MSDWLHQPVSEAARARVRGGVLRRIRRRTRVRRAGLGMAAAVVAACLFWPAAPELESLALAPPPPPAAPALSAVRTQVPKQVSVQMARASAQPAARITIYTDDPDVVIVLVADEGGE